MTRPSELEESPSNECFPFRATTFRPSPRAHRTSSATSSVESGNAIANGYCTALNARFHERRSALYALARSRLLVRNSSLVFRPTHARSSGSSTSSCSGVQVLRGVHTLEDVVSCSCSSARVVFALSGPSFSCAVRYVWWPRLVPALWCSPMRMRCRTT
eukprot:2697054-Rhodomonas_salina.3